MVAQVVSWAKAGGTNRFVRLPMSLIRPRACEPSEPNEDTTKVQILIREPGVYTYNIHIKMNGGKRPPGARRGKPTQTAARETPMYVQILQRL